MINEIKEIMNECLLPIKEYIIERFETMDGFISKFEKCWYAVSTQDAKFYTIIYENDIFVRGLYITENISVNIELEFHDILAQTLANNDVFETKVYVRLDKDDEEPIMLAELDLDLYVNERMTIGEEEIKCDSLDSLNIPSISSNNIKRFFNLIKHVGDFLYVGNEESFDQYLNSLTNYEYLESL